MSDLRSFLKQHATIPNEFIDSFLSMYNPETVQTDSVIDADKVAQWLKIPKYQLLAMLRESYREGFDYITTTSTIQRKGKYGGNNYKKVLLTPDCFKRLCMRSRSKRAEEVRTYFIQLESLLVRYRTVLLKGMDAEIKQMEWGMKPKSEEDSAGYIYVIRADPVKDSVYKIGRTQNLNQRLSTYSTGKLDGVDIVYKFRTDNHKRTEACVKLMLKEHQLRKYKEVYQANIDMIKELINKCDDTVTYTRVYSNTKAAKEMTGGYYIVLQSDNVSL